MVQNAYEESTLVEQIKKRKKANKALKIAFLDIDLTMTGSPKTTNATRKILEIQGYAVAYVTSRTAEMLMTNKSYKLSKKHGFSRPQPKLGRMKDKYINLPIESIEPEGLLNPDVIAGTTGAHIMLKQTDGSFITDQSYINEHIMVNAQDWRKEMLEYISEFNKDGVKAFFELYEDPQNYINGLTNIHMPDYRIVLKFQSNQHKRNFRSYIHKIRTSLNTPLNLRLIDDSNPEKEQHILALTPKNASKTYAVDHIIDQIVLHTGVELSELNVLIAGDSFPDLEMGFKSANGTKVTFLLVGGSRLSHALTCIDKHEAYDDLIGEVKQCMHALTNKGYYRHHDHTNRHFIVCDEACRGKTAVESLYYLLPEIDL